MPKQRTWILLRGLMREQRHWGNFATILQSHLPDDKLYLHDFAGNGHRYKEKSAISIREMVEDIRLSIEQQSIEKPVFILALSLGAMVAIEWMKRYPDECAGSVLISTSLRGLNPFYQRLLPANYPVILKSLMLAKNIYHNESRILSMVSNTTASDNSKSTDIIEAWVSYARQYPVSASNGLRQLIAAMRFNVPEQRPVTPMLLLTSMADQMVSPECSLTLAEHWQLPIEIHDTAGHDIPLDDEEWVCHKITLWLKAL